MGSCAFPVMREFTLVIVGRFRGERSFDPLMKMVDVFFFRRKYFLRFTLVALLVITICILFVNSEQFLMHVYVILTSPENIVFVTVFLPQFNKKQRKSHKYQLSISNFFLILYLISKNLKFELESIFFSKHRLLTFSKNFSART